MKLIPQITTYAYNTIIRDEKKRIIACDYERFQPLVYLSPPPRFTEWLGWCAPTSSKGNKHGYVTLYAHIVKVDSKALKILKNQYCEELVSPEPLIVERIIPFRYRVNRAPKPINKDQVLRKLSQIKNPYRFSKVRYQKAIAWFMEY